MQSCYSACEITIKSVGGVILLERNRFNVNIVAHHIGGQDMPLGVIDNATRCVQCFRLNMFIISELCQFCSTNDLPVVEATEKSSHAQAHKQEDEHLTITRLTQFCTHLYLLSHVHGRILLLSCRIGSRFFMTIV